MTTRALYGGILAFGTASALAAGAAYLAGDTVREWLASLSPSPFRTEGARPRGFPLLVVEIRGTAEVFPPQSTEWVRVTAETILYAGSLIRVQPGGLLRIKGGENLVAEFGSGTFASLSDFREDKGQLTLSAEVFGGEVRTHTRGGKGKIRLQTLQGVVESTEGTVNVAVRGDDTRVDVAEGTARIEAGKRREDLEAGGSKAGASISAAAGGETQVATGAASLSKEELESARRLKGSLASEQELERREVVKEEIRDQVMNALKALEEERLEELVEQFADPLVYNQAGMSRGEIRNRFGAFAARCSGLRFEVERERIEVNFRTETEGQISFRARVTAQMEPEGGGARVDREREVQVEAWFRMDPKL